MEEKTTLQINPEQIPDLHWKLADKYHTTGVGQQEDTDITIHNINVKTNISNRDSCVSTRTYTMQSIVGPLFSSTNDQKT